MDAIISIFLRNALIFCCNDYDEFSPISQELEEKLHEIDGIDWENSNLIEGAYVTTVISKKGLRPYDEGLSNLTDDNMVEGFS